MRLGQRREAGCIGYQQLVKPREAEVGLELGTSDVAHECSSFLHGSLGGGPKQRGLADARLAGDDQGRAVSRRLLQEGVEHRQLDGAAGERR